MIRHLAKSGLGFLVVFGIFSAVAVGDGVQQPHVATLEDGMRWSDGGMHWNYIIASYCRHDARQFPDKFVGPPKRHDPGFDLEIQRMEEACAHAQMMRQLVYMTACAILGPSGAPTAVCTAALTY